ncbi:MAG: hypothetical protein IRZ00_16360 [Gemmatimonadetes bacterium]|nr:hypothetical protein [Gemmatimonadota bacterium]
MATTNGIRLATAVAALVFVGASVAHAQEPAKASPAEPQVCKITLDPASAPVQAEPVQVKASLSQAIGAGVVAAIQEEGSGLEVALAGPDAAGKSAVTTPNPAGPAPKEPAVEKPASSTALPAPTAGAAGESVALTLNTQAAKPGEYTLTLKGESGTCTGKLTVEGTPK